MKKTITLFFAFLMTIGLSAQEKTTDAKVPIIHFEKESVDYGTVLKGSNRFRTLKVSNKGTAPLLITHCEGSCGCTIPTCPREPILPGKSAEIQVSYDTERLGPINKSLNIKSNDPASPIKIIPVKGEVNESAPKN